MVSSLIQTSADSKSTILSSLTNQPERNTRELNELSDGAEGSIAKIASEKLLADSATFRTLHMRKSSPTSAHSKSPALTDASSCSSPDKGRWSQLFRGALLLSTLLFVLGRLVLGIARFQRPF